MDFETWWRTSWGEHHDTDPHAYAERAWNAALEAAAKDAEADITQRLGYTADTRAIAAWLRAMQSPPR